MNRTDNKDVRPIALLSGPVGAGKTTVAAELVALWPAPLIYMEGDRFWGFIAESATGSTRTKSFRMTMAAMVAAAVSYALHGYDVLLDFSIPPWFLDAVRKIAFSRKVPVDYVVLRPSEAVCTARAASRPEGTIPDYTKYSEFYRDFDEAAAHILQDDAGDPKSLALRIRKGLVEGIFRLSS